MRLLFHLAIGALVLAALSGEAVGETLREKQSRFAVLAARLILHAESTGLEVTLGEVWRSAEQAAFKTKINAEKGIGIANSVHRLRLAIDLNLFRQGRLLSSVEDYRPLGEWWEKQCADCRWGGRFKRADAVHFSITHGGVQ